LGQSNNRPPRLALVELPIAGLISEQPVEAVAAQVDALDAAYTRSWAARSNTRS
jgi:adenine deaminase